MKAVVVRESVDNYELAIGQEIEVIGFVHRDLHGLEAVWRDDQGYVWTISTTDMRMVPNTDTPRLPTSIAVSKEDFKAMSSLGG